MLLSYQRPHIAVDPRTSRVTGVFWAPPFEGPLMGACAQTVGDYYEAYRVLDRAIREAPSWNARMAVGEMLVFNNRRMLHGRKGFELCGGVRHLRGGYVNIDEFANTYNLLRRAHHAAAAGESSAPALGNQDWASGPIELPPLEHARPAGRFRPVNR